MGVTIVRIDEKQVLFRGITEPIADCCRCATVFDVLGKALHVPVYHTASVQDQPSQIARYHSFQIQQP